jgi:hypothetical protein
VKALLLLLLLIAPLTVSATCHDLDPAVSVLTGKVIERTFYGPPNYGENPKSDSKERQALLVLDHPICVRRDPSIEMSQKEQNQELITLVPIGPIDLRPFLGKHVRVSGKLFRAITGHHHTPVLISLSSAPVLAGRPNKSFKPNPLRGSA